MKKAIDFLTRLRENNNKVWFDEHKDEYKEAIGEFNAFAEELISEISRFDPTIGGLTLKDCTYRIYRDLRFSPNKDPYKTHFGAYIVRGGKKSGYAGYYFHIEPQGGNMTDGHFLVSGLHMPEAEYLRSVREDIVDHTDVLLAAIKKAKGFEIDRSASLKRLPLGYTPDEKYDDLLKLKDICLCKYVDDKFLLQKDLAKAVADEFRMTKDFLDFLNRAIDYVKEEI